ncbi:MAG: hypothetical protein AABY15_06455 [Nanoarchaeota archaeon]
MKKWKKIYELFKQSNLLDEMDLQFIKISEDMLATKKPICKKIVYSELWLSSWIQTTRYKLFMQQCVNNIRHSNVEIY